MSAKATSRGMIAPRASCGPRGLCGKQASKQPKGMQSVQGVGLKAVLCDCRPTHGLLQGQSAAG